MADFVIGAALACLVTLMLFSTGALVAVVIEWAAKQSERVTRTGNNDG